MTPERIEEIKQMVEDDDVTPFGTEYIVELLAALEEAQQQNERLRKNFMFSGSALAEAQQTIEEANIALDLSIEETKRWSTLADSAMADNERLRRMLEEIGVSDPEEGEIQP